jgi:D-sedoheptulose 7-phosphate isomerase
VQHGAAVYSALTARISAAEAVRRHLLTEIDTLAVLTINTLHSGGRVFFAGNGGSAADAQHLAAEYVGVGLSALALTTDTSVLTALANDFGYAEVFARQVRALAQKGDLLVLHSTSGESENLVRAAVQARHQGVATAALLAKGGGRLAGDVNLALVVPTASTPLAQEAHMAIGHVVFDIVREALCM